MTIDREKLRNALDEFQDFHTDYVPVLRNIIAAYAGRKCLCNANICDWCMAENCVEETNKCLPVILEAAQAYLNMTENEEALLKGRIET